MKRVRQRGAGVYGFALEAWHFRELERNDGVRNDPSLDDTSKAGGAGGEEDDMFGEDGSLNGNRAQFVAQIHSVKLVEGAKPERNWGYKYVSDVPPAFEQDTDEEDLLIKARRR